MSTPVEATNGAITDVPGILVGHFQRVGRGWQTGTTTVLIPAGATPGVDVRGGGPGTRETDALGPQKLVPIIHGLCLTGGSAFGLRAADGVMDRLAARGIGFPVGPDPEHVVPVVPAAVIFDLGRGGRFDNRPDHSFGDRATRAASAKQSKWGAIGAGTGARAGGLQGGVGTASTIVTVLNDSGPHHEYTVGALVVVNANGSPINPRLGLPWESDRWDLHRPIARERRALIEVLEGRVQTNLDSSFNTTIGVVATSARLTKSEVTTLASVAHDGLARAIRPAHSLVDGDTVFGLATGQHPLPSASRPDPEPNAVDSLAESQARVPALNLLLDAAAQTFADACTHAVLAATSVGDVPSYLDLCPSARRDRSSR